jgi:hypothetical protein
MFETILILKIRHQVGLKASQFESVPSNMCCADVSGLYKLFNLLTELHFGNNYFKSVFLSFLSYPNHESLNVKYISLYSSCQVKKGTHKTTLESLIPPEII